MPTARREHSHENIKEVVKPFDWSYSTDYKGTLSPNAKPFSPSDVPIPVELLKRPDPILFFDDVMLYEDELADNGISVLSCKIRVMPDRLLLLSRFFMRLDNVVVRLRDTRVYIDFDTLEVIREYQAREMAYDAVRRVSLNSIYCNNHPSHRRCRCLEVLERICQRHCGIQIGWRRCYR